MTPETVDEMVRWIDQETTETCRICNREHQPRERAVPCLYCNRTTFEVHAICARHTLTETDIFS